MATMASIQPGESQSPLPNPPFVFPARDVLSSSAPPSYSRATGRRPVSTIELSAGRLNEEVPALDKRRSIPAALTSFPFNPSALETETGMASPPMSPGSPSPRAIPLRHRRGTSEFIGGKSGSGMSLMNPSPTKESTFGPANNPNNPRRGHAHRRSAALSTHDLSMILKPNNVLRGGSAPTTPSDRKPIFANFFEDNRDNIASTENSRASLEHRNLNQLNNRARVGFSDNIEIIPRPLSIVSSESSSTVTMRGHSVSGSLASIVSGGTSSPLSREQRASSERGLDARPRSAGPRLDGTREKSPSPGNRSNPRRQSSNPLLNDAGATPTSLKSPTKKWSFFGHEHELGESSPSRSRPSSAVSAKEPKHTASTPSPASDPATSQVATPDTPINSIEQPSSRRSSISKKPGSKKNQKKVKSWAGSILSRKTRQRSGSRRTRTPTPPLRLYQPLNEASTLGSFQPELSDGNSESSAVGKPDLRTDFATWRPRHIPQQEESMSPIIDLDAALGPFNTPSGRDAEWEAVNAPSGMSKRGKRMHSAAGMGNFLGPGMHYHRRAESAPEFENPRFGLHRLGSSSTMADVFEEDEEDDVWEDTKASSERGSTNKVDDEDNAGLGIGINVVDADDLSYEKPMDRTVDESSLQRGVKRKGSGLSEGERRQANSSSKSELPSLKDVVVLKESPSPVEIVDDSIPRPDSSAHLSDSTATPPSDPRPGKDLAPVDIQPFSHHPPSHLSPTSPHSTTQSSLPSPHSPFSYDTQRISTAPSSIADEGGFQSLLLGEPGPELRMSVDDVPSLTSSNSTMTRDSIFLPMTHNPQFREGQRSASLSSAAVNRKRSSIASLSRLISSSHGEKSKLSIESRAPHIMETGKKGKGSKSKRISRMMQFWKPKE